MPARRKAFTIGTAVALSLLLHGVLLTAINLEPALLTALSDAPPIEARLVEVARPPAPPPALSRAASQPAPVPRRAVEPEPEPEPGPAEAASPEIPAETVAEAEPLAEAAADAAQPEPPPVASAAPAAPLNHLAAQIELLYEIRFGPARGEQTVRWTAGDGRYTLTSVTGATGLTRMLYSGQLIQISQGRVTAHGLQPEAFWDQRGKKRSSGRFDHPNRTLAVSRGDKVQTLKLPEDTQDSQSLPFHFALNAPRIGIGPFHVFDGRKLRPYFFTNHGEVMLDTPLGALRALHLERKDAPADRRFEVWLAIDMHYLPVRVLRPDDSGADGELMIRSIAYPR